MIKADGTSTLKVGFAGKMRIVTDEQTDTYMVDTGKSVVWFRNGTCDGLEMDYDEVSVLAYILMEIAAPARRDPNEEVLEVVIDKGK